MFQTIREGIGSVFSRSQSRSRGNQSFTDIIPVRSTEIQPYSQEGSDLGRDPSIIGLSDTNPLGLKDFPNKVPDYLGSDIEEDSKKNNLINIILNNKNITLSRDEAKKKLKEIEKDLIKNNHFKHQGSQGISLEEAVEQIYGNSDLDNIYTLPNTAPEETWDHIETVLKNCETSKSEDFSDTLKSDDFSQKILDLVNSLNESITPEKKNEWEHKLAENFINKKTNDPNVRFFDATPEYDKHCREMAIGVTLLERYQNIVRQINIQTPASDKVETFLRTLI